MMRKIFLIIITLFLLLPVGVGSAQETNSTATDAASSSAAQQSAETQSPTKSYEIPFLPRPDGLPGATTGQLSDPRELRSYFFVTLFPKITKFLISIVAVGSFVMLLVAGLRYLTALGDTDKGESAKNTAIYAIVGLVVALLSFVVVQLVSRLPLT